MTTIYITAVYRKDIIGYTILGVTGDTLTYVETHHYSELLAHRVGGIIRGLEIALLNHAKTEVTIVVDSISCYRAVSKWMNKKHMDWLPTSDIMEYEVDSLICIRKLLCSEDLGNNVTIEVYDKEEPSAYMELALGLANTAANDALTLYDGHTFTVHHHIVEKYTEKRRENEV